LKFRVLAQGAGFGLYPHVDEKSLRKKEVYAGSVEEHLSERGGNRGGGKTRKDRDGWLEKRSTTPTGKEKKRGE